ncbi:hypothetical protein [Cohnella algarum]|uniref:hypothetical protein n=1 Tax=Cohnella algarum TaxID=2044859 RepID=UPI001967E786|nr:hypothetical protein [Cohnella algarum]MBN2981939.1 hypothetical protein [Cohnella algarum]
MNRDKSDEEFAQAFRDALDPIRAGGELRQRTLDSARKGWRGARRRLLRGAAALLIPAFLAAAAVYFLPALSGIRGAETISPAARTASLSPNPAATIKAPIPSYIPAGYRIEEVVSSVPEADEAPEINIRFASERPGFLELTRREAAAERPDEQSYYPVEIDGKKGWIRKEGEDAVELILEDGDYEYRITGTISEGEAVKMALSIERKAKEDEETHE